jgi:hypothetical protein
MALAVKPKNLASDDTDNTDLHGPKKIQRPLEFVNRAVRGAIAFCKHSQLKSSFFCRSQWPVADSGDSTAAPQ